MLVLYVLILPLPPAGVSSIILRSILHSISEARGVSFFMFQYFCCLQLGSAL